MEARVIATISFIIDEDNMNENYDYAGQLVDEMQRALKNEGYVNANFDIEKM